MHKWFKKSLAHSKLHANDETEIIHKKPIRTVCENYTEEQFPLKRQGCLNNLLAN